MRVLIFSAAAGGGHIRTAQALEKYINHHVVDAKVKVVDALKEANYIYDKLICKGYHFVATKRLQYLGICIIIPMITVRFQNLYQK